MDALRGFLGHIVQTVPQTFNHPINVQGTRGSKSDIQQDFAFRSGATRHAFQLSIDVLNLENLINSSWGVRKVAPASATSPLTFKRFDAGGAPVFNFTGPLQTYIDDPSLLSRWRVQIGLRYFFD